MSCRSLRPRRTVPETVHQSRARLARARLALVAGARRLWPRRLVALVIVAAATLAVAGCARERAEPPRSARTPTPLDPGASGTITGHVRFTGEPPPPRRVPVVSDPTCAAAHPDGLDVTDVRTLDGMLADAFVYVAHGLEDRVFAVPETAVVVDQRGCLYVPRVAGAQVGQRIEFVNSDDTLHNVHGAPTLSKPWNFGLAFPGARRAVVIEHAEVPVAVECDVHPWMRAALGVVDHPYFAVTDLDGAFTLAHVPAGRYVVAAWHPRLAPAEHTIDVAPGGTVTIDLVLDRALSP
jgi:plastocyanin